METGVVQIHSNGIEDEVQNHHQQQLQHQQIQPQLHLQHGQHQIPHQQHHPHQLHQHQQVGSLHVQHGHHPPQQDDGKNGQPVQVSQEEIQGIHAQMMAVNMNGLHQQQSQQQQHHSMGGTGHLDGFEIPMDPSSGQGGQQPPAPVGFDSPYAGMNHHMLPHQHPANVMPPYDQQQVM